MKTNVIQFEPEAAEQVEPLEAAVLEVSAHIRGLVGKHRIASSRIDELRAAAPSLRRRRARRRAVEPSRPVTFFSIEEAPEEAAAPPKVA